MKIKLNDSVFVCTGKDKGKVGTVTKILLKDSQVVVEGVNQQTKHVKAKGDRPGERVTFFAPLSVSNVALIDPTTGKPTRIRYEIQGKQKIRIASKSGAEITGQVKKTASKTVKKEQKEKVKSSHKTSKKIKSS